MKPHLQTTLGQQLTLTPQLRQAIHLLQLPVLELEAEVALAVESNPLLEWAEDSGFDSDQDLNASSGEDSGYSATQERHDSSESSDAGDSSADNLDSIPDTSIDLDPGSVDERLDLQDSWPTTNPENDAQAQDYTAAEQSLQDYLLWQLRLAHCDETTRLIAAAIIEALDENGYLRDTLQNIGAGLAPDIIASTQDMRCALHLVQAFDPTGVGAENLSQCLLLQLRALPANTAHQALAMQLVAPDFLEQLPKQTTTSLAKTLQSSKAEVDAALQLIRTLNPRPGANYAQLPDNSYITPDCILWRQDGVWRARLANSRLSKLIIQPDYQRMAETAQGETGKYLRQNLSDARTLLKNIHSRGETLLRVVHCLVNAQAGFLEFGPAALRPLTLREVADELGLHESTISRTISRKYIQTPKGTLALRDFFSAALHTEGGGETSSTAIQAAIRSLVDAENPKKPLSDAALTKLLEQRGIKIARRTVSKYREALGIASSQERTLPKTR